MRLAWSEKRAGGANLIRVFGVKEIPGYPSDLQVR